jgi:DNA-binding MarR family transcriptional regulator
MNPEGRVGPRPAETPQHEMPDREAAGASSVLAGSVGFLLSKLGFHVASRFARLLEPLGINPGHFGLLRIVDVFDGRSQQSLGEALSVPASRMVALIDDLEAAGLVARRRSAADRRVNTVHLTAEGRRLLDRASVVAGGWERALCAPLTEAERETLLALLQRVAAEQHLPIGVHPTLMHGHPARVPDDSSS